MTDDELLEALAEAAAEDAVPADALDPATEAWERLARGELTLAEAEADADARGLGDDEKAELRALYAPVDPLVKKRIAAKAEVPRTRDMPRRVAAFVGAFAVAALALLFLWPRGTNLPEYELERLGGDATTRSETASDARYGPTDRLEIRLRPATRVEHPVDTAAYLDGERWDVPLEVSDTGAVRLVGPAGALLPELGAHRITFVLGDDPTLEDHARKLEVEVERVP